ncbi:MAG: pyridoxamine 5'-phosphate oxidase [Proteobacteria bacterium]|nr:MAG: pyridoxamine 5'-phosphate oxidase [Pseudomonadota bacterium]
MAKASLKSIAKLMKGLDLCMLTTCDGRGVSSSRPMSNNHDVEYDGTSYFFTWKSSRMVKEITKNPNVSLQFSSRSVIGKPLFISITGKAKMTSDRATMEEHYDPELEIWFEDGLDTKGIVMLRVEANHLKYWRGTEEGEYSKAKSKR